MIELRTERLILRPARLEDAPAYVLGIGDYDIGRFLTAIPWPCTLAMAMDWLRQAPAASAERGLFAIDLPGQGLIGCVSLDAELGYWLMRRHWNKGYATEAVTALLDWHFAETPAALVSSCAQRDNRASLAVLRKLGFEQMGRQMRFSQALQHNVDHLVMQLTRTTWLTRGARS